MYSKTSNTVCLFTEHAERFLIVQYITCVLLCAFIFGCAGSLLPNSGCLAVASGGPVVFAYFIECVISLRLYFDVKLGGVVGLVGSLNRKVL